MSFPEQHIVPTDFLTLAIHGLLSVIETLHHISHLISTYLQGSWKNLLLANSILPHTQCVIFLEVENEVEEKILKLDKHEFKSHLLR